MTEATAKSCPRCTKPANPVFYMGVTPPVMRGWYCESCKFFDQAIRRERTFTLEPKR